MKSYKIVRRSPNRSVMLALIMLLSIAISACTVPSTGGGSDSYSVTDNEVFSELSNEYFVHAVTSDSITLNYTLAHPEKYGIKKPEPTLGTYGEQAFEEEIAFIEDFQKRLEKVNYRKLGDEQKLTYDILSEYISGVDEAIKFMYYGDAFTPTQGIQAELPILFAEYHIYEPADFDDYIGILKDVPRYFSELLDFEEIKKEKGTFMAKTSAISVIEQCNSFIENPESNLLLTVFEGKLDALPELTAEQRVDLIAQNRDAVLNAVIPAYKSIIDRLTELNEDNDRTGGLSSLALGKEYYEIDLKDTVGTDKSPKEVSELLEETISRNLLDIRAAASLDESLFEILDNPPYPDGTAEEMLDFLKDAIGKDYPELADDDYILKHVDKSLEEDLSPAFYLSPPIDQPDYNAVYLNDAKVEGQAGGVFPVLAHEAYPGHLFQTVYFSRTEPDPVREMMNFSGYKEGWATYVEFKIADIVDLKSPMPEVLHDNAQFLICLYGRIDVGINYEGWTADDTKNYLSRFGITDKETITQIFDSIVAEPVSYMKYALGGIEFEQLRSEAEKSLGDRFDSKEFHKFILETGPAQFYIVEKWMKNWIKTQ